MSITTLTGVLMGKLRNLIPKLLAERQMSISELQLKAGLNWVTTHKVATEVYIPPRTSVNTLHSVATALGVGISDLFEEVED